MSQPPPNQPTDLMQSRENAPRKLFGIAVMKWVFALEYALQGLVNPFQGATYQPFFRHLRVDYGLSAAATQNLFAKAYLAWGAKPVLGFLIDAYGRTRALLVALLAAGTLGFLLTPLVDRGALIFFGFMFLLSVAFAATDVAVDRATVIEGEEESKATGRSRSTTVGLNQAICWAAIYGTGMAAAVLGGYAADHIRFPILMVSFAVVPALVLLVALRLPRDRARPIPLKQSILGFWRGLHTGPILGVMVFYFVFHFQPGMGALWTNHLLADLHFSQTEVGLSDGAGYAGYFLGVLLFTWKGTYWQDRFGLRRLFRWYILLSVGVSLTQYVLVDPLFSAVAGRFAAALPFLQKGTVRLLFLCAYSFVLCIATSLVRMSTFSLVGAVVPVAAAGSLFAGFMSVANLAFSFSYSSGAWLYEHGSQLRFLHGLDQRLFAAPTASGGHLSISMLLLVNSLAYLLSFACVHVLPNQRDTAAAPGEEPMHEGPERWQRLGRGVVRAINLATAGLGLTLACLSLFVWKLDVISTAMMSFFSAVIVRKTVLDALLRRGQLE